MEFTLKYLHLPLSSLNRWAFIEQLSSFADEEICQCKYKYIERSTWRSGVRSAMRAASQLPGKGPTDVDDAPAPAR